ncbi:heat shock factor protein 2 isoform X2 [Bombina bombina]|uniref:heat shock factor protein 2 isoform X2 n=1 Tax=Bombina bombina TaxID=8345 RepID=UPI00235AFB02|nr:heat shock factor protein 2 isoform X2 [Bombina bombina]
MKPIYGVPKFLTKIMALVEDSFTDDYICWSQDGASFIVLDEERFAKEILPRHFKHSNMASFVRQLNWYGFHKVMHDDEIGALKYGAGKYQHPFFQRGQEQLLTKIKRKVSVPRMEDTKPEPEDMPKILTFLHQLQGRQDAIDSTVESLKRENEALWKEVLELRQKQFQPQFDAVASPQTYDRMMQTNPPLMIDSTGNYNQQSVHKGTQETSSNRSQWSLNGRRTRGTKRSLTIKEDPDSSADESSNPVMKIEIPHSSESEKSDDSDNSSDFSSNESDEMPQEDTAPDHSSSFVNLPGSVKKHCTKTPNKLMKTSKEQLDLETEDRMNSSGSEDISEQRAPYSESGHTKRSRKESRLDCLKTEDLVKQMYRDTTGLTKRVLALEQKSLQKLSEISTVLSNLANFMMNNQDHQRPLVSTSTPAEVTRSKMNESHTPQRQRHEM